MTAVWQALIAATPAVLAALIGFFKGERRSRIGRRIREHVRMAESVASNPRAKAALDDLVAAEAEDLRDREAKRRSRRLSWANVVGAIVLTVIAAASTYGLVQWVAAAAATFWVIVAWLTLGLVGLFLAIVAGAAWTTILQPATTPKPVDKRPAS